MADAPVRYMERTRLYYRALGYENDYVWAHHAEVPFTRLGKPLSAITVGLVSTAGPGDRSHRDERNRRQVWSGLVASPPASFDTDVAWDKESTHTEDRESFLPLAAAQHFVAEGRLGALAARFHAAPTEYSQAKTIERDAPEILRRLREDGAEAAILTALCPVCHQTESLVARHLEANGMPTVLIGAARDIVEYCGVPRFVFSDVPLGNPYGHPWDREMQRAILRLAFDVLESATGPCTTVQSPFAWKAEDPAWRERYARVRPEDRERLLAIGDERRRQFGQPPRR